MPKFSNYNDLSISPFEFLEECGEEEIEDLIGFLLENGELSKDRTSKQNIDLEWSIASTKILNSRHLLSIEDEKIIIKISDKLV